MIKIKITNGLSINNHMRIIIYKSKISKPLMKERLQIRIEN